MEKNGKKLIVVLGMHRSGTSVIARGLKTLGVDLGNNLMPPVQDNPQGFWEDLDINALNREMLAAIKRDWQSLTPIQTNEVETLCKSGYHIRAVELLKRKASNSRVFGFKDPRLAKLSLFWKEVFSLGYFETSFVICLRHPLSVSSSLAKRDGFDLEQSHLLWLDYTLASINSTMGEKCIVVDYDRLMLSPYGELERLANRLNLKIDAAEFKEFQEEFLERGLQHTQYQPSDLMLEESVPSLVREMYTILLNAAKDNLQIEGGAFKKQVDLWNKEFSRQKPAFVLADKLTTRVVDQVSVIRKQQDLISEKARAIDTLSERVADRERVVQELNRQLREITISKAWRAAMKMRRLRVLLFPPGSFRTRIVNKMISVLRLNRIRGDLELIRKSVLFDQKWYLAHNPDIKKSGLDAARHYLRYGGFESRDPSLNFSSNWYLKNYADVLESGVNPLVHYLRHGKSEGRLALPKLSDIRRER